MNNIVWSNSPEFFQFNPYARRESFFKKITRWRDSGNADDLRRYLIDRRKMTKDFCQNLMCDMASLETEIQNYLEKKDA